MRRRSFLAVAFAILMAGPLTSQVLRGCIGDDNLAAPWCNPVQITNLPQFPSFKLQGIYCCLANCDLEAQFKIDVTTDHLQINCDVAIIPIRISPGAAGAPGFSAVLLAKYARTWVEPDPNDPNAEIQIWRFLVNTDATPAVPSGAGANSVPCPIPPHPPGIPTHFTGHIDYACVRTATGATEFRMALNLNHLPGCISHNLFSASPLLPPPAADGHHERSYHLVAPATFKFQPLNAPAGPIEAEALRSTIIRPYTCLGEAPVPGGILDSNFRNWLCPDLNGVPPAGGPFNWYHQTLIGDAICDGDKTRFFPSPLGAPAPPLPTGFVSLPLGAWDGKDSFPGVRELTIHWGLLLYKDACNPNEPPFHIVTGVTTQNPLGGFVFGQQGTGAAFPRFTDLEDMVLAKGLLGPYTLGFGTFFLSRVVWNLNSQ